METRAELVAHSQRIGRRVPYWIQGPGGNVSFKEEGTLYIKASGVRLEEMGRANTIVEVDIDSVRQEIESIQGDGGASEKRYALALQSKPGSPLSSGKPSMETAMHLFLPGKWVFHFHSLTALLMAHERQKKPRELSTWFEKHTRLSFDFVPPLQPGLLLSRHIQRNAQSQLFVLENHGVLLQGNEASILDEWTRLEETFQFDWGYEAIANPMPDTPTPLRLYFPDSAVFLPRLKAALKETSNQGESFYILAENAWTKDRDVAEIWKATELLYRACPALKELPPSISQTVASLPTEVYRQQK